MKDFVCQFLKLASWFWILLPHLLDKLGVSHSLEASHSWWIRWESLILGEVDLNLCKGKCLSGWNRRQIWIVMNKMKEVACLYLQRVKDWRLKGFLNSWGTTRTDAYKDLKELYWNSPGPLRKNVSWSNMALLTPYRMWYKSNEKRLSTMKINKLVAVYYRGDGSMCHEKGYPDHNDEIVSFCHGQCKLNTLQVGFEMHPFSTRACIRVNKRIKYFKPGTVSEC